MKPLVNYCRWNRAALRLRGRDEKFIRGQLVFSQSEGGETTQDFLFELATATLTLLSDSGDQTMILDEMGIPKDQ